MSNEDRIYLTVVQGLNKEINDSKGIIRERETDNPFFSPVNDCFLK